MTKYGITKYNNAAVFRLKNRRVAIVKKDNGNYTCEFVLIDKEDVITPSCEYKHFKGKLRVTTICLSELGIEQLIACYNAIKKVK
jgi:hypothetical protein